MSETADEGLAMTTHGQEETVAHVEEPAGGDICSAPPIPMPACSVRCSSVSK